MLPSKTPVSFLIISDFDEYLSSINLLVNNNSASPEIEQKWIYSVSLNVRIKLNILNVIQEIDYAGSILGSIPS